MSQFQQLREEVSIAFRELPIMVFGLLIVLPVALVIRLYKLIRGER